MHPFDEGLRPPEDCVLWCSTRQYDIHVLDDGAIVDLDWWNRHLERDEHEIRLKGRDLDGRVVSGGRATILRNDLRLGSELVDTDHAGLGLLFLCAAWQSGHGSRQVRRRFPDVRNPHTPTGIDPLATIKAVLDHSAKHRRLPDIPGGSWTGWPDTPGVGVVLLATYLWAVGTTVDARPAQLVDQHGVSTLIHQGWLENPAVTGFTLRRYTRYVDVLDSWAAQAETRPELVERWLVERWAARLHEARTGALAEPTLF